MSIKYRYFYADRPSPAWDVWDELQQRVLAARESAQALAKELGGIAVQVHGRIAVGIVFSPGQGPDPKQWKLESKVPQGNVYAPIRRTKAGKELYERLQSLHFPSSAEVLRKLGMWRSATGVEAGRSVIAFSSVGYREGRLCLRVPQPGEDDKRSDHLSKRSYTLEVPDFLTEWEHWQHVRWFNVPLEQLDIIRQDEVAADLASNKHPGSTPTDVFDIGIVLHEGDVGPEPSIREMVERYYRQAFTPEQAMQHANDLIRKAVALMQASEKSDG